MLTKQKTEHQAASYVLPLVGTLLGCLVGIYVTVIHLFGAGGASLSEVVTIGTVPLSEAVLTGIRILLLTYLGLSLGMVIDRWIAARHPSDR
ncbi:hypothetical protein DO97_11575 [Neosynechococcus sphagnicola sy1]|uniref:Uncharacterized protein n=1 Tax=Neosynechococcus sphagnicola sy1 TaxID=1497020 RepID=A0A098TJB8_9CYAN|nr:hypothetical protein [Neosynechococcus sphagnicola]KGF72186.1 hypothetical protein DO97_11575 [Neosynechococcus sphagnicola sy1]